MLKCTLRSLKTINGGIGEKNNFFRKTFFFEKKVFFLRFFFNKCYIILESGGHRKQTDAMVASGMSFRWT